MTGRSARRARWMALALRAFPKRWRDANGDEFLATAAQLGADGLSRPMVLDLIETVLAGWDVRLATRPPLRHRLAYRLLRRPVPAQWHGWMRDDLTSRWVGLRFGSYTIVQLWAIAAALTFADQGTLPEWYVAATYLAITLLTAPLQTRSVRRHVYRKAGWSPTGAPSPPPPPPGSVPLPPPPPPGSAAS